MSARLRFAVLAIGLFAGACATSEEQQELPPPKRPPDANTFIDTNVDTTVDETAVGDSAADSSMMEVATCEPLTSENRACGKCGTQTRTCSSGGVWNEWSICGGEKSFTSCSIGDVRVNDCGKCGTQKDTCDPVSCEWVAGACLGEPVSACTKGETETSTASCPTPGEVRTRTCGDKCTWGAYGDCTLPKGWIKMAAAPTGFDGRIYHSAVWTGTEMIVWGGYGSYVSPSYGRRTGASYNLGADTWKNIALPPSTFSARYNHTAVWTGSKMIVWGGNDYSLGYRADGAIYDPSADSWTVIATASPLAARYFHQAVWSTTTNEMIVWGGYGSSCSGGTYCADGASFDPATGTWTTLPAPPIAGRWKHSMVWTGTELIVWGGQNSAGYLRDGARYDPKTKIWTKFADPPVELDGRIDFAAVWSGKELLVWGGYGNYLSPTYGKSDGARYLPGGSWTRFTVPMDDIFATGTVATRHAIQAWYGGGKLYLWAGANGNSSSGAALTGAVSYDPSTDKWTTLDVMGAPTMRARASVVWTGKEAIIWGGSSNATGSIYYADGTVYRP